LDTIEGLDPDLLVPPDDFWQARHFTVEPERGLEWQRDAEFRLDMFTVPHIFVAGDGSFVMLATKMDDPEGRWYLTSTDGLEWTAAEAPIFLPTDFPQDCGNRLEDGTLVVDSDGSYRLLLEGTELDEDTDRTSWRAWCQATSADGLSYQVAEGYFYEGSDNDGGLPSVPSSLHLSDWSALIYYMGDIYSEVGGLAGNGIRVARRWADDDFASPWITSNILPSNQLDPMPVYLEGGGVRLYHTSTLQPPDQPEAHLGPAPGYTDSADAANFDPPQRIIGGSGNCLDPSGGECLLDPAFLRLDDGTLVLYFTWLDGVGSGDWSLGIGRAFATD